VDSGVSLIDTADIYGGGSNEELIAQLLRERRNEARLATKFGRVGNPAGGYTDIRGEAA
jgi:aryl-alcohol dehydrogenase-like predicted oxidoreductase